MSKPVYQFDDFLKKVDHEIKDFVSEVHTLLEQNQYKIKIEHKAAGFFLTYIDPMSKQKMLNFLFLKKGLCVRLYGSHCNAYPDVLNGLPEVMLKRIDKAKDCIALVNPEGKCICNTKKNKKSAGYEFFLRGKYYQKCRTSCFYFHIDKSITPFLLDLLKKEHEWRMRYDKDQ